MKSKQTGFFNKEMKSKDKGCGKNERNQSKEGLKLLFSW